jgi:hypothetical protein
MHTDHLAGSERAAVMLKTRIYAAIVASGLSGRLPKELPLDRTHRFSSAAYLVVIPPPPRCVAPGKKPAEAPRSTPRSAWPSKRGTRNFARSSAWRRLRRVRPPPQDAQAEPGGYTEAPVSPKKKSHHRVWTPCHPQALKSDIELKKHKVTVDCFWRDELQN